MSQSLCQIYVHLVFSTKHRIPMISDAIRDELHAYIGGVLRAMDSPSVRIGSVPDHIHVLFSLSRNEKLKTVIEEVKKQSSKWIKTKDKEFRAFYWQRGYGAFSVSSMYLDNAVAYVERQRQHHRRKTYQEEFRELLLKNKVEFDERYVWD